jgi:hypothetical protein
MSQNFKPVKFFSFSFRKQKILHAYSNCAVQRQSARKPGVTVTKCPRVPGPSVVTVTKCPRVLGPSVVTVTKCPRVPRPSVVTVTQGPRAPGPGAVTA